MGKMVMVYNKNANGNQKDQDGGAWSEEKRCHAYLDSRRSDTTGSTGRADGYQSQRINRKSGSWASSAVCGLASHGGTLRCLIQEAEDQIAECEAELQLLQTRKEKIQTRRVALWKLRPSCASDRAPGNLNATDVNMNATPDTHPPDQGKSATPSSSAPDTCGKVFGVNSNPTITVTPDTRGENCALVPQVSGVNPSPSTPDTLTAKHNHWVEVYRPNKRRTQYFRYVWMVKQKMHHIHIPGGNVRLSGAQANVAEVEIAIAHGAAPAEVLELIKRLRGGKQK